MEQIRTLEPDNLTVHSLALKRAARLNMFKDDYKDYKMVNTQEHMELTASYADEMGLHRIICIGRKYMAGNLENVGYAKEGKAGIYNILIMEEKQTIVACGPELPQNVSGQNKSGWHSSDRTCRECQRM